MFFSSCCWKRFRLSYFVLSASLAVGQSVWANEESQAVLRFRLTAEPATLDWNLAHTSHETHVIMNLMEGLIEYGPDLTPVPALAERWEISPDGKTYHFYLRSGVQWSDGRVLRAQDFVDSWLRLLSPKTRSSYANFLFDVENAKEFHDGKMTQASKVGVRAIDDKHLEVKLTRRVPYFIHLPTFWVTFPIRLDLIAKYRTSWAEPRKLVTLGPYLLKSWKKGSAIRLEQNPVYYKKAGFHGPVSVDAVIELKDASARDRFSRGEFDFLLDPTTEDLLMARQNPGSGLHAEQYPYLATFYLGMNTKSRELNKALIRRALSAGIEREGIPALLQGGQTVAKSWLPPGIPGHSSDRKSEMTLLDAKAILAKEGYVEGKGFPRLTLLVEKFDGAEALAEYIKKSFFENLGIKVEPKIGSPKSHQAALKKGAFTLFVGHWGADYPDPANFFEVFSSGSGTNYSGWSDSEFDALMEKGRSTSDQDARLAAYARAEKILLDSDAVIVPLFYKKNTVLLGKRVKSFEISPLNYFFLKKLVMQ